MLRAVGIGAVLGVSALFGCGGDTDGTIVGPLPAQLVPVGGDKQAAFIGHPVPLALVVAVENSDGSPAYGESVRWTVTTGGGSLSSSSGLTDSHGIARVNWTLGTAAGAQSVTASADKWDLSPVTFSATGRPLPLVIQNTGSGWNLTLVDTANVSAVLTSLWGSAPTNVVGVGSCSTMPIAMTYTGASWTRTPSGCAKVPPVNSFPENYTSVWGNSASDIFATRHERAGMFSSTAIDHFDGQSWKETYKQVCSSCTPIITAVWTGGAGSAIAVGENGTILRYDGTSWSAEASGTTVTLNAIWGAGSSGPVFAVGDAGTILINTGTGWSPQTSGTTQPLFAVWGNSASDVFAVGGGGTILHYDGTSWSSQASGSTEPLRSLWGSASNSIYAVGDASTILRYDGATWTSQTLIQTLGAPLDLTGVWGASPSNVLAVGVLR